MIVFDLICRPEGHVFEAWFGSSDDYDSQKRRGLIQCPLCEAPEVEKAISAPRVAMKGNQRTAEAGTLDMASSDPENAKYMLAAMAAAQRKVLEQSEYVGDRFADEARAIHLGEADRRPIYGRATVAQSQSLAEEGIAVTELPFPILEPGREN